ncbi:hypothetical protein SODALDRAFT_331726 [Sodiomyces alkalinus F11]|uniref:Uncharacterized protein n=1 Tax=Sodiomyces alkalinus (strain CBS 110278 / VKM F-3762 / F11) TaxID=1314773 RepID=A0A3N2PYW5_SODAK|nr:hypothetical protein SODALDRAFT_331726 [Sodiomyces alkalinus F11]ROT39618.1 hypothetical protein SODALDRAFT_331726 [Sodiomyces alkalinus F11]
MRSSDHRRSNSRQAPESTSGYAGPLPYYHYKPLPPLPTTDISLEDCSQEVLTPAILNSVLVRVSQLLGHIPYAVCGRAAIAHYGYRYAEEANDSSSNDDDDDGDDDGDEKNQVRILCPSYARQVIRGWAAAAGLPVSLAGNEAGHAFLAVTVPEDKSVRKVRIEWMRDDVFKRLGVASRGEAGVRVLAMPELINDLAGVYIEERTRRREEVGDDDDDDGGGGGGSANGRHDGVARQIVWLLGQIDREGLAPEQRITEERVPNVVKADFWTPFTFAHPGAAGLFYDAGFEPPTERFRQDEEAEEEAERMRGGRRLEDEDDDWRAEMESLMAWTGDDEVEASEEEEEAMRRVMEHLKRLDSITDDNLWRMEVERLMFPEDACGVQAPPVARVRSSSSSSEEEEGAAMSFNDSQESLDFALLTAEINSMLLDRRRPDPKENPDSDSDPSSSQVQDVEQSSWTGRHVSSRPRLRRMKGRYFFLRRRDAAQAPVMSRGDLDRT